MTLTFPPVKRQQTYRKLLAVRKGELILDCLQVSIKRRRMSRKKSFESLLLVFRNLWIEVESSPRHIERATREDSQEGL
jgi:hypothetical protein